MNSSQFTHGLCQECLASCNWEKVTSKKPQNCVICNKQPDFLYNQEPYCASCYIASFSSPVKSEISDTSRHKKSKSFLRPINKEEVMNRSFFNSSGKLLRKIEKLFSSYEKESNLISHLHKKAALEGEIPWQKLSSKVNKNSFIVYIFVGKEAIVGAFHTEAISLDGQHSLQDSQSGIFYTNRYKFDLEFSKVKDDRISYSKKSKAIRFGYPSSLQIYFEPELKMETELCDRFEWIYFYVYRF